MRLLKRNFQRLDTMYKESQEEIIKIKAEHNQSLTKASEEYARLVNENEALKDKNETLYKLSKSYLERQNDTQNSQVLNPNNSDPPPSVQSDITEIIEEENTQNKDWSTNILRGFKKKKVSCSQTQEQNNIENSVNHHPSSKDRSSTGNLSSPLNQLAPQSDDIQPRYKRYCQFFANTGKCAYEERTGNKCRYLHEKPPLCKFGINCSKMKCIFSHPRLKGVPAEVNTNDFLGNIKNLINMINPWLNQSTGNPWNIPARPNINPWQARMPAFHQN